MTDQGEGKEGEYLSQEHLDKVDEEYYSPEENAQRVMQALVGLDFNGYEMLCFAYEYLGWLSMSLMEEDLIEIVKEVSRFFYSMHYTSPEDCEALKRKKEEVN